MDREPPANSPNPSTILVVDPDDRIYKAFWATLGSRYHLVFTPNEALANLIINDFPFAMVFVGQNSTTQSDSLLIRTLKAEQPSIPIVFIAKKPTADLILSSFRAGARDIITAPIEPEELMYITERIATLRLTGRTSDNLPPSSARFNLRNLWSQLRYGSQGYVEIGMQMERQASSLENGTGSDDSTLVDRLRDAPAKVVRALEHRTDKVSGWVDTAGMRVYFLGHFRTIINGQMADEWPSKKGKSLFAYLSYHYNKPIFRDVLMDVFWPKSMAESARNSLNVVIHGLRKRLQQFDTAREYIIFKNECYCINPEIGIWTDVDELRALWRKGRAVEKNKGLEAAVEFYDQIAAIYSGDFMSDELYEDWSTLERENLKEIFLVTLEKISENRFRLGNLAEAISICKAILGRDGCREEIYRRLMCCYQKTGRRDKALLAYRKCVHALKTELDVAPAAATIELYKKIKTDAPDPCESLRPGAAARLPKAS
ncbi:MAG: winged helix-turn-helix domain-containing protein [Deltaproteobacteria bacterium]|nr:winged helix-turn-helix domain-containing protein [Deltaproteobacteria bacterium]